MPVRVTKGVTETGKNVMLPSQLFDVVPGVPRVSDCMNDGPENVFFKRLETRYSE